MKVALCISGFMRSYSLTYNNLCKFLLEKYNPDIFIHTWDWNDLSPIRTTNEQHIRAVYSPKKLIVDNFPMEFPMTDKMKAVTNRDVPRLLSMYYKVEECNKLKQEFERENDIIYDAVIRFRPDLQLLSPVEIEKDEMNKIHIPTFGDFGGINDQLAFSSSKNMDKYSNLYSVIPKYSEKVTVNPEILLHHHLKVQKLSISRIPLHYGILRPPSHMMYNEARERKLGFIK